MKAAYIEQTGPAKNIIFGNLPKPKPAPGQVLVRVEAVAVNPVDTYIRSGEYPMDITMPYIVGSDFAGEVAAVSPEVTKFHIGDRVWGSNQGVFGRQGTFAEFVAVDEHWLYPTPEEVSDRDAAAVAMVAITAHLGLFREANLKMGDSVFIGGGTGGVGSCAVQMAKTIGARVLATAGNKDKVQLCRQLGASTALNYKTDDINAALDKFGEIDVWFDTKRNQDFERVIPHMARNGRIILMSGSYSRSKLPIASFFSRDCKLLGYMIFNAPPDEQRKSAAEINRWLAKERIRPLVDRVMKLSDAAEAHHIQEQSTLGKFGKLSGKIVLTL